MPLTRFFAKFKLNRAIKYTEQARKAEGDKADELFEKAYQDYSAVVASDSHVADALYNWGAALFYQSLTKSGEEAQKLLRNACEKFSSCLGVNPDVTSAAIDWGVALMELARVSEFPSSHSLYDEAREKFLRAEQIQIGSASYNLACIHSLRHEIDECHECLERAKEWGNLPTEEQMVSDADLANIQDSQRFQDFLQSLKAPPKPAAEQEDAEQGPGEQAAATGTESESPTESRRVD